MSQPSVRRMREFGVRPNRDLGQNRAQAIGCMRREDVLTRNAMLLQHVLRQIDFPPRGMMRESTQQSGQRECDPGMARKSVDLRILSGDRQLAGHTASYLRLKGYQASAYTDPQQAVSAADSQPPDAVLIDLLLAGRSGVEFLYELRSYPEWQNIPVIISGYQLPGDLQPFKTAFDQLNVSAYLPAGAASLAGLERQLQAVM